MKLKRRSNTLGSIKLKFWEEAVGHCVVSLQELPLPEPQWLQLTLMNGPGSVGLYHGFLSSTCVQGGQ